MNRRSFLTLLFTIFSVASIARLFRRQRKVKAWHGWESYEQYPGWGIVNLKACRKLELYRVSRADIENTRISEAMSEHCSTRA